MPRVKLFDEQEVLKKAMHLFWKKGYYATSVQDLVDESGINRASLYDTFGGKKELFTKAFTNYREVNTAATKKFLFAHENVREGFGKLFARALRDSETDTDRKGCFTVNTTVEFMPNEQEFAELLQESKTGFEKIFTDYLQYGVRQGQIASDKNLRAAATLFFTFFNGLKVVTKTDFDPDLYLQSVDALLSVLD